MAVLNSETKGRIVKLSNCHCWNVVFITNDSETLAAPPLAGLFSAETIALERNLAQAYSSRPLLPKHVTGSRPPEKKKVFNKNQLARAEQSRAEKDKRGC